MSRRRSLELYLPGLEGSDYEITSPATFEYNCIAWVIGESDRLWNSFATFAEYWPSHLPRDDGIDTFTLLFEDLGFERCDNDAIEDGYTKLALYGEQGRFRHVARQFPNGRWTSKLGLDVDIEHDLEDLIRRRSPASSYRYGEIVGYMKRQRGETAQ